VHPTSHSLDWQYLINFAPTLSSCKGRRTGEICVDQRLHSNGGSLWTVTEESVKGNKGNNNKKMMLKLKIKGMLSGFYGIAMRPT
jgi:hypothetical protein